MSITQRAKTVLKSLARRGDFQSQGAIGEGVEQAFTFTNAETADADWILATAEDDDTSWTLLHTSTGTYPRNVTATFGASWAGGDITVTGKDQFGNSITEVIADSAGNTVAGVKIFASVSAVTKQSTGAGGAGHEVTIGFGTKLGLPVKLANSFVTIVARASTGDYTTNQTATIDATYSAFTPSSAPDAAYDYQVIVRS